MNIILYKLYFFYVYYTYSRNNSKHIQEIRSFTRESIIESIVDLINYLQQDQNLRKTVHSKIYILKRRCKLTNFIDLHQI